MTTTFSFRSFPSLRDSEAWGGELDPQFLFCYENKKNPKVQPTRKRGFNSLTSDQIEYLP